jgi:hypothetical protein
VRYGTAFNRFGANIGRREKPWRNFLLPVCHDMQRCHPAIRHALEHVALPSHRRHDQRRFDTCETHVMVAAP